MLLYILGKIDSIIISGDLCIYCLSKEEVVARLKQRKDYDLISSLGYIIKFSLVKLQIKILLLMKCQ